MSYEHCPSDLLVKERRNELSSAERRQLQRHLASCESCRAWRQLGRDFDRSANDGVGDRQIVERIAATIRAASITPVSKSAMVHWSRPSRQRHRGVRWLAAGVLATTAAAAAAVAGMAVSRDMPPAERATAAFAQSERHATDHATGTVQPEAPPTEATPALPVAVGVVPASSKPNPASHPSLRETEEANQARRHSPLPPHESETALSLYREANQARRAGERARAISLFRRLQQTFPRSAEARLSNVALGSALLESGVASEALQQFDRYLGSNGDRALAAEALYGRARSLGSLGHRQEELGAWKRLLAEYPRSPYAAVATRRVDSLE